jgi:subtilisin family serine protease
MRSSITKAAAVAALALSTLTMPARAADTTSTWIVTLGSTVDPVVEAPILAAAAGGTVGHVYANVLGGFSFVGTDLQADVLRASALVASVVADGPVHLEDAQLVPTGVSRVDAPAATDAGHTGDGVTVAVIDSGIDLLHPDLLANLHPTLADNCVTPAVPPQDDNSHGTHVAGIVAAADNGVGVVGVAPAARLVPVKAFDAAGNSTWATVICGIDYVAAPAVDIDVVNLSFGDLSTESTACDGVTASAIDALRQSICDLTAAGVVAIAAAGNDVIDVAGFVPAAFPETIAVSALTDLDGQPGGVAGCIAFGALCDDSFASLFSNYGARIDVMAPGVEILSTMPGALYGPKDGTSMAAPHVAGVVALMLEADPSMTPTAIRTALRRSGECPDGTTAGVDGGCAGQGSWALDPDGVAEPLVHAFDEPPTASIATPTSGSTVAGTVVVAVDATDDREPAGTLDVQIRVDTGAWQAAIWNVGTSRYERAWSTGSIVNGVHTIDARATDAGGQTTASAPISVTVANGMHVGDLDGASLRSKKSWRAKVTVTVHGATETLLNGAVVSFAWSGGTTGTGTCTTGRKGTCSVTSGTIPNAATSATFTVTDVSKAGQTFTPATDHDPDGSSDGTTIVVPR